MKAFAGSRNQIQKGKSQGNVLPRCAASLSSRNQEFPSPSHPVVNSQLQPGIGYNFGQIPIHPPAAAVIQTKLKVNQPGDEYEQEAERVAGQVMRMAETSPQGGIPLKRIGGGNAAQTEAPPIVSEVLRSPGQPLDAATRAFMELRFGHDFGQVRVHTDAKAAESARAINALAYTAGRDVVFAVDQYAPSSGAGRRLLCHELAHVLQQSGPPALANSAANFGSSVHRSEAFIQRQHDLREETANVQPRSVAEQIAQLQQARDLYLANPSQKDRVLAVLDSAYSFISHLQEPGIILKAFKGQSSMNTLVAEQMIGQALGGLHSMRGHIRIGGRVSLPLWNYNIGCVYAAREYLEVVAGDVRAGDSKLVSLMNEGADIEAEVFRFGIELTPIVGSLVMIGEAIVGKSITGKKLSTGERALLGAASLLAEVGSLIRAGKMAVAASRLSTITGETTIETMRLCRVSRALTEAERSLLTQWAAKVKNGMKLTESESFRLNRLLGKLNETDRAMAIRQGLTKTTGKASEAGRFTNLNPIKDADDIKIGEALAHDLSEDVVRIPEDAVAPGAKNPDLIIGDKTAEIIKLNTTVEAASPINNALTVIAKKHKQAGIVIADLTNAAVDTSELLKNVDRLWGRPEFSDVTKLIVTRAGRVAAVVDRPVKILEPILSTVPKGAATAGTASAGQSDR